MVDGYFRLVGRRGVAAASRQDAEIAAMVRNGYLEVINRTSPQLYLKTVCQIILFTLTNLLSFLTNAGKRWWKQIRLTNCGWVWFSREWVNVPTMDYSPESSVSGDCPISISVSRTRPGVNWG